jgi:hypothetical protein
MQFCNLVLIDTDDTDPFQGCGLAHILDVKCHSAAVETPFD